MCGMVRPESRHATALRGARSRFLDEPSHFSLNLLCLKRARENTGKVVLRRVPVLFRYRFYAETDHWDEKKPTRYRAKAGPEVVLRKVSVLFAISSMPKRAIGRRTESFSGRTIPLFIKSSMPKTSQREHR